MISEKLGIMGDRETKAKRKHKVLRFRMIALRSLRTCREWNCKVSNLSLAMRSNSATRGTLSHPSRTLCRNIGSHPDAGNAMAAVNKQDFVNY